MDLRYTVVLEPEMEGGFSVSVPAFPEAHTQGETIDECLFNAREVIELVMSERRAIGEEIPEPDAYTAIVERVAVSPTGEPVQ